MSVDGSDGVHAPRPCEAEPVDSITVSGPPNGQIDVKGNVRDPFRILGILETGKSAIIKRGAAESSSVVPGTFRG